MVNIGYILTLENGNRYVVTGKVKHKNITYYELGNINNMDDMVYCYLEDGMFVNLENQELINILIPLFRLSLEQELEELS